MARLRGGTGSVIDLCSDESGPAGSIVEVGEAGIHSAAVVETSPTPAAQAAQPQQIGNASAAERRVHPGDAAPSSPVRQRRRLHGGETPAAGASAALPNAAWPAPEAAPIAGDTGTLAAGQAHMAAAYDSWDMYTRLKQVLLEKFDYNTIQFSGCFGNDVFGMHDGKKTSVSNDGILRVIENHGSPGPWLVEFVRAYIVVVRSWALLPDPAQTAPPAAEPEVRRWGFTRPADRLRMRSEQAREILSEFCSPQNVDEQGRPRMGAVVDSVRLCSRSLFLEALFLLQWADHDGACTDLVTTLERTHKKKMQFKRRGPDKAKSLLDVRSYGQGLSDEAQRHASAHIAWIEAAQKEHDAEAARTRKATSTTYGKRKFNFATAFSDALLEQRRAYLQHAARHDMPHVDPALRMYDHVAAAGGPRFEDAACKVTRSSAGLSRLMRVLCREVPIEPVYLLTREQANERAGGDRDPSLCTVVEALRQPGYAFCTRPDCGGAGDSRYGICRAHLMAPRIYREPGAEGGSGEHSRFCVACCVLRAEDGFLGLSPECTQHADGAPVGHSALAPGEYAPQQVPPAGRCFTAAEGHVGVPQLRTLYAGHRGEVDVRGRATCDAEDNGQPCLEAPHKLNDKGLGLCAHHFYSKGLVDSKRTWVLGCCDCGALLPETAFTGASRSCHACCAVSDKSGAAAPADTTASAVCVAAQASTLALALLPEAPPGMPFFTSGPFPEGGLTRRGDPAQPALSEAQRAELSEDAAAAYQQRRQQCVIEGCAAPAPAAGGDASERHASRLCPAHRLCVIAELTPTEVHQHRWCEGCGALRHPSHWDGAESEPSCVHAGGGNAAGAADVAEAGQSDGESFSGDSGMDMWDLAEFNRDTRQKEEESLSELSGAEGSDAEGEARAAAVKCRLAECTAQLPPGVGLGGYCASCAIAKQRGQTAIDLVAVAAVPGTLQGIDALLHTPSLGRLPQRHEIRERGDGGTRADRQACVMRAAHLAHSVMKARNRAGAPGAR